MSIIFVDSDILLDIILQRKPYFDAAANLLIASNNPTINCCTSVNSILNVHYLAKKVHGENLTRYSIQQLLNSIDVVKEDASHIHQSLTSDFSDFEDGVQYFTAVSANADFIITRNTKDYKHSAIPVLTDEQFLLNTL